MRTSVSDLIKFNTTNTFCKYRLSACSRIIDGVEMYRINAVKRIPSLGIDVGDVGGFVESELNLSQTGSAWIHKNSFVKGSARVSEDAVIGDNCQIFAGNVSGISDLKNVTILSGDRNINIRNCLMKSDTFMTISLGHYHNSEITEEPIQIRMFPYNINTCGEKISVAGILKTKKEWLEEIYKFAMENKMNDILYSRYVALLSSI